MLRKKDLKKGQLYTYHYLGNECVSHVTEISAKNIRCHYSVGLWDDSESYDEHDPDHVSVDINLHDIDVDNFMVASPAAQSRYMEAVKNYSASAISSMGTLPGIKVVGKINLDKVPSNTHPTKATPDEKKQMRLDCEARNRGEWNVTDAFRSIKSPDVYHYRDEEIVHFNTGERSGLAIGMVDEVFQRIGFYVAMNMYGTKNQIFKYGDMLDNGMIIDGWPDGCKISRANSTQKEMGEAFLIPMYREQIDAYHTLQQQELQRRAEEERLRKEDEERQRQAAIQRLAEERARLQAEERQRNGAANHSADTALSEHSDCDELPIYDDLKHLPYLRGEKRLMSREWPRVSCDIPDGPSLLGLHNLASHIFDMRRNLQNDNIPLRTYLLSSSYYRELMTRKDSYLDQYSTYEEVVGKDSDRQGAIVFTDSDGQRVVLLFQVRVRKVCYMRFAYIADDRLLATHWSYSGRAMGDNRTQLVNLFPTAEFGKGYISRTVKNCSELIFAFLCMEKDANNIISSHSDGSDIKSIYACSTIDGDDDVDIRDATWYTNVFINHSITVDPYKSHRWCGSGPDKHLEEVLVSGYTKSPYTINAKVNRK